ncbi:MAG: nitrile hydratase subunit beta [Aquincola sp.]|nr:nitrile hydratase subunit beta [Aquincola sp.]MDH4288651.1 nitrile hydratase subunit beta [Aquincola sp.]MDH5330684.1 nitrile hydratase subunit beta [Aquincola sp.]
MNRRYATHADLGGQRGHGRITPEPEGELFHAPWEPRALALTLAMGATGSWNIDMSRAARETLPGYARCSYYEIWFEALCRLLAEHRLVWPDEAAAGRALHGSPAVARTLRAADVPAVLAMGSPTARPAATPARFAIGQAVRMHGGDVPHHTRLPRYVRGKRGVVEHVHGTHVFADAHALGRGEDPRWLYTVVFRGSELWPGPADAGEAAALAVSVDAWEPYLEPA